MPAHDVPISPKGKQSNTAWEAVRAKPWDFDAWMALIQPLEKAGVSARPDLKQAYEEFLKEYPLCYGYWDKLARLERTVAGGSFSAAAPVYERGLAAVKCWELYLKYCSSAVHQCGTPPDHVGDNAPQDAKEQSADEKTARDLFQRAVEQVGNVFNCAKLWDAWHAFEEARPKDVLINGEPYPVQTRVALVALRAATSAIDLSTTARFHDIFVKNLSEGDAVHIAKAVAALLPAEEQVYAQINTETRACMCPCVRPCVRPCVFPCVCTCVCTSVGARGGA